MSREAWIAAGQDLLCEVGIAGMRLAKLTARLKVSSGSFYHHFNDFDQFLGYVAEYYDHAQVAALVELCNEEPDPKLRITRFGVACLKNGLFRVDAAMRVWASSDERPAAVRRRAEALVLEFLKSAFEDAGWEPDEAAKRARIMMSVNVAVFSTLAPHEVRRLRADTLELLFLPPQS